MCSIGNTGLRVTLHCIQTESRSYMVFRVTSSVAGGVGGLGVRYCFSLSGGSDRVNGMRSGRRG